MENGKRKTEDALKISKTLKTSISKTNKNIIQ